MPSRNGGAGQVEHLRKTGDPGCHAATEAKHLLSTRNGHPDRVNGVPFERL
jgi:hypothetical protein